MTMVNRELDNIDASRALSKMEIKILDELRPKKTGKRHLSDYITCLGMVILRQINTVIWRGLQKLTEINLGVEIRKKFLGNQKVTQRYTPHCHILLK